MKKEHVSCRFGKWGIGFDYDSGSVTVDIDRYPLYGELTLADASLENIADIRDMFGRILDVLEGEIIDD